MAARSRSKGPAGGCHRCHKKITGNAYIRVGKFQFHKHHFTCNACDKSLHGVKFHHRDGKFYCTADFQAKFAKKCLGCQKKIVSGKVLGALGGSFHPQCFVCAECKQAFKDGKYFAHEGKPYCETHFQMFAGKKCNLCQKPVLDEDKVEVQDKVYHTACLLCTHCRLPLGQSERLYHKDGVVYCKDHFLMFFAKNCTGCGEPITTKTVSVNKETYHPACLRCSVCDTQMNSYMCRRGHLLCAAHAKAAVTALDCTVCKKPIALGDPGGVMLAAAHKTHADCFQCTFCHKTLQKTTAKVKDGFLSCLQCLMAAPATAAAPPGIAPSSAALQIRTDPPARTSQSSAPGHTRLDSTQPLPEEEKIEWQKGSLIGTGSFGKVYMAMNKKSGELIAVKQMVFDDQDNEQARQLEQEINLMRHLKHPNIVQFLGCERVGKTLNILMEYVPGSGLDTLLAKFGAFGEEVVRSYTEQLLKALNYCHHALVTHRDIKSKNILVDTHGNLFLADFGSAKRFDNFLSKDAPSVSYSYTPLWTAPEVLMGDYNYKIDVWSLGCVIIEMATAQQPWEECKFENPFRALYHIGNSDAIPALPEGLSPEADDFLLKCLQRDPEKRWDTAQLLQHPWILGQPLSTLTKTPDPHPPGTERGLGAPAPQNSHRRGRSALMQSPQEAAAALSGASSPRSAERQPPPPVGRQASPSVAPPPPPLKPPSEPLPTPPGSHDSDDEDDGLPPPPPPSSMPPAPIGK